MKKYETLKNEITKALTDEKKKAELFAELRKMYTNEALIFETMNANKLMHLLQCRELDRALTNSKYQMCHDSNYESCRAETVETKAFSLLDTHNKRALHIYSHDKTVDIVFSSDKTTQDKLVVLETLKHDYRLNRVYSEKKKCYTKTEFKQVAFDKAFEACKFALLILESTAEQLQEMINKQNETKAE